MLSRHPLAIKSSFRFLSPQFRHPHLRSFHATRPQHGLLEFFHETFHDIHTLTGLSWTLSLPLTALLWRVVAVPFLMLSTLDAKRTLTIKPLQDAYKKIAVRRAESQQAQGHLSTAPLVSDSWAEVELKRRETFFRKKYNLQPSYYRYLPAFAFLPIWMGNFAVLQSMCGIHNGILSMFLSPSDFPPPEPGFALEGPLIDCLSEGDSTLIFPLLFIALQYASISRSFPLSFIEKQKAAIRPLRPDSRPYLVGSVWIQFYQLMWVSPIFIGSYILYANTPVAVCMYLCCSAATQLVLSPLTRKLVGLKRPPPPLTPQVPQLKRRYRRTMHQMDVFSPPGSDQSSTSTMSSAPDAQQDPEMQMDSRLDLDSYAELPSSSTEKPKLKASVPRVRK